MKRYILTGTPGAGKTAILRQLELDGYGVVEEAATDIIALEQAQGIAEPWSRASFIDAIVNLQRARQLRAARLPNLKRNLQLNVFQIQLVVLYADLSWVTSNIPMRAPRYTGKGLPSRTVPYALCLFLSFQQATLKTSLD